MWSRIKCRAKTGVYRIGLVASLMVLVGCASTLSARVTTFQQWPDDTYGATYQITPGGNQAGDLEYQTFADMIRAAIGRTGLVEAPSDEEARFELTFTYASPVSQTWVQQYNDPYFYQGFGGPMFSPWGGYYRGWGGGVMFAPSVVQTPVTVYNNTLTVTIKDRQQGGAEVYRTTAVHGSTDENLLQVMPYLARAVFDGFPGNNGQVREISYERMR